jgi:steroid delta-isomerase-like uncharacterized protein
MCAGRRLQKKDSWKFALGVGWWQHTSGGSKRPERRKVSEEENKAVIRRWIEAYNERDMQAEADVLAPGFVAHVSATPGPLEGLDAWRQFTAPFTEAFPDLRLTVQDIAAEGITVAARVAFRGTHRGEFQGIPPTGKEVAFSSMEFNRVVDGKVEEHWVEINLLGLVQQLGVATIPGPRLLVRVLVGQAKKLRSRLTAGR